MMSGMRFGLSAIQKREWEKGAALAEAVRATLNLNPQVQKSNLDPPPLKLFAAFMEKIKSRFSRSVVL
jgi:hypothetical protein